MEENTNTNETVSVEDAKQIFEERMSQLRNQSMALGFKVCCKTALDKIYVFEHKIGKKSANDYKRLIKDLKKLFERSLGSKADDYEETEEATDDENVEETVQN